MFELHITEMVFRKIKQIVRSRVDKWVRGKGGPPASSETAESSDQALKNSLFGDSPGARGRLVIQRWSGAGCIVAAI